MKRINLFFILLVSLTLIQCKNGEEKYAPLTETNPHYTEIDRSKPFYQGTIVEVLDAGGYSYFKIKESLEGHKHQPDPNHQDFWIVVERTPAKIGDEVRFQKELVTKNYTSESLNKTFDELMFASNIQRKVKSE
jgi:hypothetical protein